MSNRFLTYAASRTVCSKTHVAVTFQPGPVLSPVLQLISRERVSSAGSEVNGIADQEHGRRTLIGYADMHPETCKAHRRFMLAGPEPPVVGNSRGTITDYACPEQSSK